ncbi:transposase [Deinococcus sp. YIM 134068]|uniref:transposase n=1 Tax=Deinococcus lichenicola TaxID=3118910 RepID=UPI002F921460
MLQEILPKTPAHLRGWGTLEGADGQAAEEVADRHQTADRPGGAWWSTSVAEAARQHGVNESLIHTWKAQFLETGRARFAGDHQGDRQTELERENERRGALAGEKESALHIATKARGL